MLTGMEENIVYWKCECGSTLKENLAIPIENVAKGKALMLAATQVNPGCVWCGIGGMNGNCVSVLHGGIVYRCLAVWVTVCTLCPCEYCENIIVNTTCQDISVGPVFCRELETTVYVWLYKHT